MKNRPRFLFRPLIALTTLLALTACGGSEEPESGGTGGTNTTSGALTPSDDSAATIAAYLADGSYKTGGWVSETAAAREASSPVSPHGNVRVWLNDAAVASQDADVYAQDSIAVKEMYEGDSVVGHAMMWKTGTDDSTSSWLFYCAGPSGRCATGSEEATPNAPIYGLGNSAEASECGFCHGKEISIKAP